jgi:integrase
MRPRKKNRHLPPCVHPKHGQYWYVKGGKWEALGKDLAGALAEYARRQAEPKGGIAPFFDEALAEVSKTVSASTTRQYKTAAQKLKKMLRLFASPTQVQQGDIATVKHMLSATPNMANRVLTVARLLFNYGLETGIVKTNPAIGVKPYKLRVRKRLLSAEEFGLIYAQAGPRLRCIMDLWRLTGQRVVDVVRIRRADLREEGIYFRQAKTDAELIVRWNPELQAAVARAKELHGNVKALTLFHTRLGGAPDYRTVYDQWRKAVALSGVQDAQQRDMRAVAVTATNRQRGKTAAKDLAGHTNESMTARYIRDHDVPVVDGPTYLKVLDSK